MPGTTSEGISTLNDSVWPHRFHSQFGIMRREPSRKPIYQSGWEPALIWSGVYGPYAQIGLICTRPASRKTTPKITNMNPPALAVYTGSSGRPTTFSLVLPGPAHCVCFCTNTRIRCAVTRPTISAGISSTWMVNSRGMKSCPGKSPPNRKNETYVPTIGIDRMTPEAMRRPVPDSRSSGSE